MILVEDATSEDAPELAAIHLSAFDDPWSASDIAALLRSPGVFAMRALCGRNAAGFILCRLAADEAEVLTLAVVPGMRRRGAAAILLQQAMAIALAGGAQAVFLEVATDNPGAQALYLRTALWRLAGEPAIFPGRAEP